MTDAPRPSAEALRAKLKTLSPDRLAGSPTFKGKGSTENQSSLPLATRHSRQIHLNDFSNRQNLQAGTSQNIAAPHGSLSEPRSMTGLDLGCHVLRATSDGPCGRSTPGTAAPHPRRLIQENDAPDEVRRDSRATNLIQSFDAIRVVANKCSTALIDRPYRIASVDIGGDIE